MRIRIWLVCAVALVVCLLLLLFRPTPQHQKPAPTERSGMLTNQQGQPMQTRIVETPKTRSAARALPPTASALAKAIAETNHAAALLLADWQTPIEFYGKVVDESTNAIAGAKVSFHWVEMPGKEGNRSSATESGVDGLFSLHGAYGPSLMVSVSKEGYYTSRATPDGFHYALANEIFQPDPQDPVIFHLRKIGQGVALITSRNGMRLKVDVRVPKDNTPVRVDVFQKHASANGQLEISQNKPPWRDATNWSFRLSFPEGGLIENQDEFQFEAPEVGYQPIVEYHFAKGQTGWATQLNKQFYIAFGQPRKYGWLRVESDLAQETVFLTYAINPSGSRDLEPASSAQ